MLRGFLFPVINFPDPFGSLSPAVSLRRDSINEETQQIYNQLLKSLRIATLRPGANCNMPAARNTAKLR
jgi:hypothetical protein